MIQIMRTRSAVIFRVGLNRYLTFLKIVWIAFLFTNLFFERSQIVACFQFLFSTSHRRDSIGHLDAAL